MLQLLFVLVALCAQGINAASVSQVQKCKVPSTAPQTIENVINECQDELKLAILSEAFEVLSQSKDENATGNVRTKREAFTTDEKKIAGCLLHCVYRKLNAVNENGFPTLTGLVKLYTEGVTDQGYQVATLQAVLYCLEASHKKHLAKAIEQDKTCDVAFDVFDCVSNQIGEYCGQTP